jgi:hypothetical protein
MIYFENMFPLNISNHFESLAVYQPLFIQFLVHGSFVVQADTEK